MPLQTLLLELSFHIFGLIIIFFIWKGWTAWANGEEFDLLFFSSFVFMVWSGLALILYII